MITDTPSDQNNVAQAVSQLHSKLENVQRELDQALEVWRRTLVDEKRELELQVHAKERAWAQRETVWIEQRRQYEERLQTIDGAFKTQLDTSEQNALRALNDLDDAWQRDKLTWNHGIEQQLRELRDTSTRLQAENDELRAALADAQAKLTEVETRSQQQAHSLQLADYERAHERRGFTDLIEGLEQALERADVAKAQADAEQEVRLEARVEEKRSAWDSERAAYDARVQSLERSLAEAQAALEQATRETEAASRSRAEYEDLAQRAAALEQSLTETQQALAQERESSDAKARERAEQESSVAQHEQARLLEEIRHLEVRLLETEQVRSRDRESLQRENTQLMQFELERWEAERKRLVAQVAAAEQSLAAERDAREQERVREEERLRTTLQRDWEEKRIVLDHERLRLREKVESLERALHDAEAGRQPAIDAAVKELKDSWEIDKANWHHGILRTIQETNIREAAWKVERQKRDQTERELTETIADMQRRLSSVDNRQAAWRAMFDECMKAVESQVSLLEEVVSVSHTEAAAGRARSAFDLVPLALNTNRRAFR